MNHKYLLSLILVFLTLITISPMAFAEWTEIQPDGNVDKTWWSSSMSSDGQTIITGVQNGRLYLSTNGGTSWTETQPAGNVDKVWYTSSMSSDGQTIIAGAYNGRLYLYKGFIIDLNVSNVSYTRADFNATIENNTDTNLSEKGFLYNTSSDFNYSTAEFKWTSPSTTDANFSTTITGLDHNTTYYAMAYAKDLDTNEYYYSTEETFKTLEITETAATPTVNVAAGEKNNNVSVQLSSSTSGAAIYYTTNGSTPTSASTLYSSAIAISTDTTLKAIAIKEGYFDSNILTASYTFVVGGTATANVDTGTYNNNQTVTLTKAGITSDTKLTYTTNGSNPTIASTEYSGAITISETTTLKFAEFKTGYTPSAIQTKTYTLVVGGTASANVDTGTYNNNQTVTLTKAGTTTGTKLTYTTNNTDPTILSTEYTTPLSITGTTILKFAEFKTGYTPSAIQTKTYTLVVANPTASSDTGTYNNDFTVTLASTTISASIYYTTDGSTPDNTDTLYSGAITINATQTLKAIAYKTNYTTSGVISKTYTMAIAGTPTTAQDSGAYSDSLYVTITKAGTTTGTKLTYTTNNTNPTISSTEYTAPIYVNVDTNIRFAEFKTGYTATSITTREYTIVLSDINVSVETGTYNNDFSVSLSHPEDYAIYYTTNGTDPDNTDTLYTTPISIAATTTLKAVAYNSGIYSNIVTKTYTMQVGGTASASVDTGNFNNDFTVTLTKAGTTTGTKLTYTTNGDTPTISSTEYSSAITINATTTLKFAEFKTGYTPSAIQTKTYTMQVDGTATANVDTGTYNNDFTVTLTKAGTTTGTKLTYTTNGDVPTISSTEYSTPISITATTTLKFAEFKAGYTNQEIQNKVYTMQVADLDFVGNDTGIYNNNFNVSATTTTNDTYIYYTNDGNDPTPADTLLVNPLTISASATYKFKAFKTGYTSSDTLTKTYTMEILGTPTANKDSGVYTDTFTVALTKINLTTGTKLTYTTNGTDPTISSTEYSSAITISETTTLKFAQFKADYTPTEIQIKIYDFEIDGDATANYDSGTYYEPISVVLSKSSTQTGVTVNYTTNGTDPTISSTEYTTPLLVDANTTLKFAQFKAGYNPSNIITKTYVMDFKSIRIQFYDENTFAALDENVSIVDLTNAETYYADENGYFNEYIYEIEWDNQYINAYVERKVSGVTTHPARNLQFYWDYTQNYDYNFMLLPANQGQQIEFSVRGTNNDVWDNKFVQFIDSNGSLVSSNKTSVLGIFDSYLLTSGDYNAVLYDATGTEGNTYTKSTVNLFKPLDEKTEAEISPYDVQVGGLLNYTLSNQTDANIQFNVFAGLLDQYYNFRVVDYNATVSDQEYVPRNYVVAIPFGTSYQETYNLQPYLLKKEDVIVPKIYTVDILGNSINGVQILITKYIDGVLTLVESGETVAGGTMSFTAYPLDTYFIQAYYQGELKAQGTIIPRTSADVYTITIDVTPDKPLQNYFNFNVNWKTTKSRFNIVDENINILFRASVNLAIVDDYTVTLEKAGVVVGTATVPYSSFNTDANITFNKNLFTTADISFPIIIRVKANLTDGSSLSRTKQVYLSGGGLDPVTSFQKVPEELGQPLSIIIAFLVVGFLLGFLMMSGFVRDPVKIGYFGIFLLAPFVMLGFFDMGVTVLGVDIGKFFYSLAVIVTLYLAMKELR